MTSVFSTGHSVVITPSAAHSPIPSRPNLVNSRHVSPERAMVSPLTPEAPTPCGCRRRALKSAAAGADIHLRNGCPSPRADPAAALALLPRD
jgi:hypothetical protein